MKFLLIAAMLAAPAVAAAAAPEVKEPSQFIVEVKGIVCAFCAYGARKNLSRVDFLDRKMFKDGLLMETEKGAVTVAIAKGKRIDFEKVFKALKKGGYEILAIHLNLSGVPEKRDGSVLLVNRYNGQEFLLLGEDGQPWNMKGKQGKEASIQAHASEAALAKAAPDRPLAVTVKKNAAAPGRTAHLHLGVEGMFCEKCVERLEKVLKGISGVRAASVNLEEKSATLAIDPAVASEKEIVEAVKEAGFSATIK